MKIYIGNLKIEIVILFLYYLFECDYLILVDNLLIYIFGFF